jgi:hypothetical protein
VPAQLAPLLLVWADCPVDSASEPSGAPRLRCMSAVHASAAATLARIDPGVRPRLRPEAILLRRSASELQVGLDAGNALRIPDPGGHLQTVLRTLDGHRTWTTVLDDLDSINGIDSGKLEQSRLEQVVRALAAGGLLDLRTAAAPAEPWRSAQIRLVGAGEIGAAVGELLVRSGIRRLHVVDDAPANAMRSSGTRAEALQRRCAALAKRGGVDEEPVRIAQHWTKPETDQIALTVVALSTLEVDRTVASDLLRRDAPHLLVRPTTCGAVVGPLVAPGRSSCLHCADLTRRDADPAWPELLRQLLWRQVPMPPAIRTWATGVAVTQVFCFLAGGRPETLGATVELGAPTYAMRLRTWPAHPECGCRWDAGN